MIGLLVLWSYVLYCCGRDERLIGTTQEKEEYRKGRLEGLALGIERGRAQVKEVLEEQLPIMLKDANYKATAFIKKATPTQRHNGTFHIVLEIANPVDVIKYKKEKC